MSIDYLCAIHRLHEEFFKDCTCIDVDNLSSEQVCASIELALGLKRAGDEAESVSAPMAPLTADELLASAARLLAM